MKSWFKRPSLTLKEWMGTFLGGGGVGRSETLWKGTTFGMDCKRRSEFQLVEEHSMSKNRTEEESSLSKQKGRWGRRGDHITNSESPGDEAVLKEESESFRGRRGWQNSGLVSWGWMQDNGCLSLWDKERICGQVTIEGVFCCYSGEWEEKCRCCRHEGADDIRWLGKWLITESARSSLIILFRMTSGHSHTQLHSFPFYLFFMALNHHLT